jgi:hypothetical protein
MMDKELAARLAKTLAVACVRNTSIEDLHAGIGPSSRAAVNADRKPWRRAGQGLSARPRFLSASEAGTDGPTGAARDGSGLA